MIAIYAYFGKRKNADNNCNTLPHDTLFNSFVRNEHCTCPNYEQNAAIIRSLVLRLMLCACAVAKITTILKPVFMCKWFVI